MLNQYLYIQSSFYDDIINVVKSSFNNITNRDGKVIGK